MTLTFESVGEILKLLNSNLMLFMLLYKVAVTFVSVDEIPMCGHSSEID